MLRNDISEDMERVLGEMDVLRHINDDLVRENQYLKYEVSRLKKIIAQKLNSSEKVQTSLLIKSSTSVDHVTLNTAGAPPSLVDISQAETESPKKPSTVQGDSVLGDNCFLFEELKLFGLSEASNYKNVEQLFSFVNPFIKTDENNEALRFRETEDLIQFIFKSEIEWKPVPQQEIAVELHQTLFNYLDSKRTSKYVFTNHDISNNKFYLNDEWTATLNPSHDNKFVCLQFNDLISVCS